MIQSKALEVNLATSRVDVNIDPKYHVLQEVMSGYYGLLETLNIFLKELSHPYKNWQFIIKEARGYSLNHFHLLKSHNQGPEAADLYVGIFIDAIHATHDRSVKTDAVDNLMLFLQKIIKETGSDIPRFLPILDSTFDRIRRIGEEDFFLFLKSYYQIKKLAELMASNQSLSDSDYESINRLLRKYYLQTCQYWLNEADPQAWFENETGVEDSGGVLSDLFQPISHEQIRKWREELDSNDSKDGLHTLLNLPGYSEIVETYRLMPQRLYQAGTEKKQGNRWKLIFTFQILNLSGLNMIHEEALRDINRTLAWLIGHEAVRHVEELVRKTFSILEARTNRYPATALNCILNMGRAVYKTDEIDFINFFIDSVIHLGFQLPMVGGVGNDWQIKANPAHMLNIRIWLEIIKLNPKWSIRLLSALVIHVSLCGVFIKDTDLFPRDITGLLNSDLSPVYNLAKQLARLFPTYFNDIGAEGKLRDISTQIDEICSRKDVLIHFLRKQSHVESSNRTIVFMEAALCFWETKDKACLEPFVPPSIYEQIEAEGPYIDGVYRVIRHLKDKEGISLPKGLLTFKEETLKDRLNHLPGVTQNDVKRVSLVISFYKLLNQKYNLEFIEMDQFIAQLRADAFPDLGRLKTALAEGDLKKKILELLDYLEQLKKIILSPETYEIREDIYKKRHITIDIPSMYGSYREMKFDALGLTFRLESLINVLFEELINNIDLSVITKATFFQVYDRLDLFDKALRLDGISTVEIEKQLDFLIHSLQVRGFTFTQYLDIFKGFAQAVKNIIADHFTNIYERNMTRILDQVPVQHLLPKYLPKENGSGHERLEHRVSEIFSRERIALSLGLQQLDLFLSRILNTLFHQSDRLPKDKLQQLLLYDPQGAMAPIDNPGKRISGIIHLGNKGLNLVRMKQYGLPIPSGFIITTEVFRCREVISNYPPAEQHFKEQVAQHIENVEKTTGLRFGNRENPLLFSVRSGSSISQPGMMDTFLNVGMNEEITQGIVARTRNSWFAWDNYRRFLQCYGMSFGLERDDFDAIISESKEALGLPYKRDFTGEQMRRVALTYKQMIQDAGIEIEESPLEQLLQIIKKVFDSWESDKAKTYRKIIGISDDWGTAVTVQSMVFGNIAHNSGSGVLFTHNPRWSGDTLRLWGDFTIGNQGEDVVSGLVRTLPVSLVQQDYEMRETDVTLETHFPEIYNALKDWANELIYDKGWSPQEMEFTFESPNVTDLFLLQTRDMVIRGITKTYTFDPEDAKVRKLLGHGIGVSGGAMSGRMVFNLEEIDMWRDKEPETPLILVRSDTVPDDIREIYASDGLLTARGGLTSHAAVVAHRLGKTCVVGCNGLVCNEKKKECEYSKTVLKSGEYISIDGQLGAVYLGKMKIEETQGANE